MYSYGRVELRDDRDQLYNVESVLPSNIPPIKKKFWWDNAWWGNQRNTPHCVAYSWGHWLEDGPVIQDSIMGRQKPLIDTGKFYEVCQRIDSIAGTNYDGTTIRAGAKILEKLGIIREYRWAFGVDTMVKTLLTLGPMVVGTKWYSSMEKPNSKGAINIKGSPRGGHAYVINGVDTEYKFFRIKNSWGQNWGDGGHAYITFDDMRKLLWDGGDACIASEIKVNRVPEERQLNEIMEKYAR